MSLNIIARANLRGRLIILLTYFQNYFTINKV